MELRGSFRSPRPRAAIGAGGFTLLELLTVIAILVGLFALSIGVYRKVSTTNAFPAATSQVSSVIRAARNYSVSSGLPSRVFVEPEFGRITAFGFELVAAWHLEEVAALADEKGVIPQGARLRGAYNESAEVVGQVFSARGKIGSCVEFTLDGPGAALVAEHRSRYGSPRGFSLEAWVNFSQPPLPADLRPRRPGVWVDPRREDRYAVISKHGSYEMGVLGDGGFYTSLVNPERDEEELGFETDGRVVVPGRWTHLRTTFDGVDLRLEVDGILREWYPEGYRHIDPRDWPSLPGRVADSEGDLTIGRQIRIFSGFIDEPKIRVALEPHSYELAPGIEFHGIDRPLTIYFDTRGSLDPLKHTRPVVLHVIDTSGRFDETPRARTAVAAGRKGEASSAETKPVGDPLHALAEYLREEEVARETPGVTREAPRETDDNDGPPAGGRSRTIIIDLTGTIRG